MNKYRRFNKNITLCLSERILENLNGQEFKDVLIKYFQKYFIPNENDKLTLFNLLIMAKEQLR